MGHVHRVRPGAQDTRSGSGRRRSGCPISSRPSTPMCRARSATAPPRFDGQRPGLARARGAARPLKRARLLPAVSRIGRADGRSPSTRARMRGQGARRPRDRTAGPASPTTSGSAPRLAAMTGTPTVIASSAGMPKPSMCDGITSTSARRYESTAGRPRRSRARRRGRRAALPARRCRPRRLGRAAGRPAPAGRGTPPRATSRRVGIEQHAEVLARLERAEKQDVPPRLGSSSRRGQSGAPGADGDAIARDAESSLDVAAPVCARIHDDVIGARTPPRARAPRSRGESPRASAPGDRGSRGRER